MKLAYAILLVSGFLASVGVQQAPPGQPTAKPSIGLQAGQKAPEFTLRDQFGQEQSNETLRGSNGTVLLFFRSADW